MTFPVFANLATGNEPASTIDTAFTDMANYGSVLQCPTVSGSANAIELTTSVNLPSSFAIGLGEVAFSFIANANSTGPVTVAVNGSALYALYMPDGVTQVGNGNLANGVIYFIVFSTTLNSFAGGFQLVSYYSAGGTTPGLEFIGEQTATNSASVAFTGLGTSFKTYLLEFDSVILATAIQGLLLQAGTGAGPSWDTTAADYETTFTYSSATSTSTQTQTGAVGISFFGGANLVGNNSTIPGKGQIAFGDTTQSALYVMFDGSASFYTGSALMGQKTYGMWNAPSVGAAITGIRLIATNGNIAKGNFRLYGYRNS